MAARKRPRKLSVAEESHPLGRVALVLAECAVLFGLHYFERLGPAALFVGASLVVGTAVLVSGLRR